jgi:hypothetical protein
MSLMAYGVAIKRYAATHQVTSEQALISSSGGDFVIAGILLVPALFLIHVGVKRMRLSPSSQ